MKDKTWLRLYRAAETLVLCIWIFCTFYYEVVWYVSILFVVIIVLFEFILKQPRDDPTVVKGASINKKIVDKCGLPAQNKFFVVCTIEKPWFFATRKSIRVGGHYEKLKEAEELADLLGNPIMTDGLHQAFVIDSFGIIVHVAGD